MKINPVLAVALALTLPLQSSALEHGTNEWLKPGSDIEFTSREVPHHFLLNRLNWVEKNERSTSKNYTLWEEADLYLVEWPGNVTLFDQDNPVVKWGRARSKYIEDHCGAEHVGIEMRAYAYKYVYLTWGPYRLTRTYTIPLTVPKSILGHTTLAKLSRTRSYEPNRLNVLVAYDIAFVFDALLIASSCGVIRVSGLEMAWAEMSRASKYPLQYSVAKGISGATDRLVVQNCCLKTGYCPFGNMVVAYKENSLPHVIYTSFNGGQHFAKVPPLPSASGHLRAILSYPELNSLLIAHGENEVQLTQVIHTETLTHPATTRLMTFSSNGSGPGSLQGARLGMEMSFILWDDCNVWYSPDIGSNATKSLFYVHKKISGSPADKNRIQREHCSFGGKSAFSYGKHGKFAILDSNNVFFLGIDTKSNLSQLVALKVDVTLLQRGTELSVHPWFDNVEQPRLLYPPKFLQLPKKLQMGKSYERRLGMRLLPKNVYPSDFILSFYEENARMPADQKKFALKKCQTSSVSVNNSLTQRTKRYPMKPTDSLNFTVSFQSTSRSLRQLHFEPKRVLKYFSLTSRPISIDQVDLEPVRYLIKYRIVMKPITTSAMNKVFRVTFYLDHALRCSPQPRVAVYIKVEENPQNSPSDRAEEDMSKPVYLKSVSSEGDATYLKGEVMGETHQVNTCPLRKVQGHISK